jgi:hypothetical protein
MDILGNYLLNVGIISDLWKKPFHLVKRDCCDYFHIPIPIFSIYFHRKVPNNPCKSVPYFTEKLSTFYLCESAYNFSRKEPSSVY